MWGVLVLRGYMKLVWLVLISLVYSTLSAHIYLNNCAARVGVANLDIISTSPLTSYYQAGVSNPGIVCSISQPFQISGIENGSLAYSQKSHNSSFALGCNYLYSDYYSQYSNFLSYNYTIKNCLTIGIGQKFIMINEEDNYVYPLTDLGLLISQEKSKLVLNYTNVLNKKSSKLDLPTLFSSEISYRLKSDTFVAVGIEKEKQHKLTTKFGIRYKVLPSLTLLSGYSLEPNQMAFGVGVDYKKFSINYAVITHPELDSTHHISLIYEL